MWRYTSNAIMSPSGPKVDSAGSNQASFDSSDDETSETNNGDEAFKCWESFNIVENVPYVLWCGHTLCKNCVLTSRGLWSNYPLFRFNSRFSYRALSVTCYRFASFTKGILCFPKRITFFFGWFESKNGDRIKSHSSCADHAPMSSWSWNRSWPTNQTAQANTTISPCTTREPDHGQDSTATDSNINRWHSFLSKSLIYVVHLTAKFPFVFIFLLIVLYAIPTSVIILVVYILVTILFAVPSFLVLYFAYPSLDWLVREIIN